MKILAWRVFHKNYVDDPTSGTGARARGGRWNSPGIPVVYASQTLALAQIEHGLDPDDEALLRLHMRMSLEFDDALVKYLSPSDLPAGWDSPGSIVTTKLLGDAWYKSQETVVLAVPSALDPNEHNYVINPNHPDFGKIRINEPESLAPKR